MGKKDIETDYRVRSDSETQTERQTVEQHNKGRAPSVRNLMNY